MKLEYFFNRIYYSLFVIFRLMYYIPLKKEDLHENELSIEKTLESNPDNGLAFHLGMLCRRLTMCLMTFFLGAGTVGVLNALKLLFIKVEIDSDVKSLVTLLELFLLALPMGSYFIWRKDKYLAYFKRFVKEPKRKTVIWCFITIVLYIAVLILFFWSLRW